MPPNDRQLTLRQRAGMLLVSQQRQQEPAFHIAEFPPVQPQPLSSDGMLLTLPRPQHPDVVEELRLLLVELPVSRYQPPFAYLPAAADGALALPWTTDRRTGLLAPGRVWADKRFEEQWPIAIMITPSTVGVPGAAPDMAHVAWRVLVQVDREALARILAAYAFRLEILNQGSELALDLAEQLQLPPGLHPPLIAEIRAGRPFLDPRCLRWILQELAVAATIRGWGPQLDAPEPVDTESVHLLEHVLFPHTLRAGIPPPHAEILRAIWLLHDGFQHDKTPGTTKLDNVLSITASLGFGHRQRDRWFDRLNQWRRVWEVPDDHAAIASNPSAADQGFRPSDLRHVFRERTTLDVGAWMAGGLGIVSRFVLRVVEGRPHITLPEHIPFTTAKGRSSPALTNTLERLTARLGELGNALVHELQQAGVTYDGLGTTPGHDSAAMIDNPVLILPDDGAWAPLGLNLLVDAVANLPRTVALSDGHLGKTRQLGGLIGHMFEAAVADLIAKLHPRHHTLSEHDLACVTGRDQSLADGIIGHGPRYLVVEASVQTLGRHIARGAPNAVRRRCKDYHKKADQAEATLTHLHDIAQFHDRPRPEAATYIVVTDVPLTLNPAIAKELRAQRPDRNPKFVCSLEEFEALLELGDLGWEIPAAVIGWQNRDLDVALTNKLEGMARFHGPASTGPRFDLQAWLDEIPMDRQAA